VPLGVGRGGARMASLPEIGQRQSPGKVRWRKGTQVRESTEKEIMGSEKERQRRWWPGGRLWPVAAIDHWGESKVK